MAPDVPVAVLVDRRTASAAEAVLVACRGRARTRSFGEATSGVPTGNARHRLPDGTRLLITTSVAADRCGNTYRARSSPTRAAGCPRRGAGSPTLDS